MHRYLLLIAALSLLLAGCSGRQEGGGHLRLATTTSTDDSGLLRAILPTFEQRYDARVDVIAVGTGQALEIARRGDVDVVLVHARELEEHFVQEGYGLERRDVMYNDFIIVGPAADPAGIRGSGSAAGAFGRIAESGAVFASRGDSSGTHAKEQELWQSAGVRPKASDWYRSLGQGMGETLIFAAEERAYTLADRGTFLSMRQQLAALEVLVGGASIVDNPDPSLYNPYGVIPVSPKRFPQTNSALAEAFVAWITSDETQQRIGAFGIERFGQPLFYPAAGDASNPMPQAPSGGR